MKDTCGQLGFDLSESVSQEQSSGNKSPLPKSLAWKERDRAYQQVYRKRNRARDLVRHARFRAHKQGVAFDLTKHLSELQARIDVGVCELSGLPFNLDGGRTWDSPSLDRIKPKIGYTYENIRVVCHAVNSAMGDWGDAKMLQIGRAILNRRREASSALSDRLGQNLMRLLAESGSPEYVLTWSRKVTPSGHLYWQQRASGLRISGSDCSGWPTPRTSDTNGAGARGAGGPDLQEVAQLAGWPTPIVNDGGGSTHCYGKTRADGSRPHHLKLPGAAQLSSPARTDAPAALRLNHHFSRWLMGYPVAWANCAPTATRSSRKSGRNS